MHNTYPNHGHAAVMEVTATLTLNQSTHKSFTPPTIIKCNNPQIKYNTDTCCGFSCIRRSWWNFYNDKIAVPLRITPNELTFPQIRTSIKTDNSASEGIVADNFRQKKVQGNGYDILSDEVPSLKKGFFCIMKPESQNMKNLFTKSHPPPRHK